MLCAPWPGSSQNSCHLLHGAACLLPEPREHLPWRAEARSSGKAQQQGRAMACQPRIPQVACHSALPASRLGSICGPGRQSSCWMCRKAVVATPTESFLEASGQSCQKTAPPAWPAAASSPQVSSKRWMQSPRRFPVLPAEAKAPEQRQESAVSCCSVASWQSRAASLKSPRPGTLL